MQQQMDRLQTRLEDLRARHLAGRLATDEVLAVMQEAGRLRESAAGSPMEDTLDVILDLLQSIWQTSGARDELRDCRRILAQRN